MKVLSIFATLLLSGCAFSNVYKTKEILKNMNRLERRVNKVGEQLEKDYSVKREAFKKLIRSGANDDKSPYPELKAQLRVMKKEKEGYNKERDLLNQETKNLETQMKGKKEISSSEPAYELVTSWQKAAKSFPERTNPMTNNYTRASSDFVATLNKNQIFKVDFKELREKVSSTFMSIEKTAKRSRGIHAKYKKRLKNSPRKTELLADVDDSLDSINALLGKSRETAKEFVQEAKRQEIGLVAPHMKSYSVLKDLQQYLELVKKEADKINQQYKDL